VAKTRLLAEQLAHGGVQAGLDVGPGAHVLWLLLAPDHLRIGVLRHDLRGGTPQGSACDI